MMSYRHYLLLLGLLVLTACGGDEDNSEPPASLTVFEPTKILHEQWSLRTHGAIDQQFFFIEPLRLKNKIITAGRDGLVAVVDARTGELLNEIDLASTLSSGVGGDQSLWLLATKDGELIAIDGTRAQVKWRAKMPSEVLSRPVLSATSVLARTVDGQIVSLDRATGKFRWAYQQNKPALTLRGSGLLLVTRDRVYAGMANGRLSALSLNNGEVIWDLALSTPQGHSEIQRLVDIDGNAELYGSILYVAGYQGRVAALDVKQNQFLWARDFSTYSGVTIDSKSLYSSDERSHIWSLDRFSGATLWKQEKLQARNITRPVLFGDYLVVGDVEGYLHVLSKFDGRFIARIAVGEDSEAFVNEHGILVPPVVTDDAIIVTTRSGMLYSYSLRDVTPTK